MFRGVTTPYIGIYTFDHDYNVGFRLIRTMGEAVVMLEDGVYARLSIVGTISSLMLEMSYRGSSLQNKRNPHLLDLEVEVKHGYL
jgi:hypothetical protein